MTDLIARAESARLDALVLRAAFAPKGLKLARLAELRRAVHDAMRQAVDGMRRRKGKRNGR